MYKRILVPIDGGKLSERAIMQHRTGPSACAAITASLLADAVGIQAFARS